MLVWSIKVTFVALLVCFGEGEGLVMLEEGGRLFSRAGLDEGNTFAATGWFFFVDGSSAGSSAGRFIAPIPPTAANTWINRGRWDGKRKGTKRPRRTQPEISILTRGAFMEVVVVLGHICQDTEAVRNLKSHHVFCIHQCWNSQLLLRDLERLQMTLSLSNKPEEAQWPKMEITAIHQMKGNEKCGNFCILTWYDFHLFKHMFGNVSLFFEFSFILSVLSKNWGKFWAKISVFWGGNNAGTCWTLSFKRVHLYETTFLMYLYAMFSMPVLPLDVDMSFLCFNQWRAIRAC